MFASSLTIFAASAVATAGDCNQTIYLDLKIRACSAIIEGKKKGNRSRALCNRGEAYSRKGEYDRAILDCSRAIELNPNFAAAYYDRGLAYKNKGETSRATDDLNRAKELKAK